MFTQKPNGGVASVSSGGGTGCVYPYGWDGEPVCWPIEVTAVQTIDTAT